MRKTCILMILGMLVFIPGTQLVSPGPGTFRQGSRTSSLLFYNVENLFHPSDDDSPGDDAFTAGGLRHWTYGRYRRKVTAVARVIHAAGGWDPPHLVGLAEVENRHVLDDLVRHPVLLPYDYGIAHVESPDHRGIDVALLYRRPQVQILQQLPLEVRVPGREGGTRDILRATLAVREDTLEVFLNHWISKYGGVLETEPGRIYQARLLRDSIEAVCSRFPGRLVLAAGDFNDVAESRSMIRLTEGGRVRLWPVAPDRGSYKYRGRWQSIDHVLVAGDTAGLRGTLTVVEFPFLLERDEKYGGQKPFRSYAGYRFNGGTSDHLPLLFRFTLPKR